MATEDTELKYWLGLSLVEGLGPKTFRSLIRIFGNPQAIFDSSESALLKSGLSERALYSLITVKRDRDLDNELKRVSDLGIKLLRIGFEGYPENLAKIPSAPFLLYVRGEILPQDAISLAVVGTRRATDYGRQATSKIVSDLASFGLTIVSGLALGIDTCAHRAAMESGGRTLAVLGHGLDQVYPPENHRLAEEIVQTGALISEAPLGFPPVSGSFPSRNRIISGLALGTLVCEAPEKSGALITASQALEQGRPVFALSGSIFNLQNLGTARLIQDGAKLVVSPTDITNELDIQQTSLEVSARAVIPSSSEEELILGVLSEGEFLHADELCRRTGLSVPTVSATLTKMVIKGMVEEFNGGSWAIRR